MRRYRILECVDGYDIQWWFPWGWESMICPIEAKPEAFEDAEKLLREMVNIKIDSSSVVKDYTHDEVLLL